jgi:hypothetical protein
VELQQYGCGFCKNYTALINKPVSELQFPSSAALIDRRAGVLLWRGAIARADSGFGSTDFVRTDLA